MAMKVYDPGSIVMTLAAQPISGFADTFVSAEREENAYTKRTGADGEVARVRSRNRSGSVTITLMATSASNDILSALARLDEETGQGVGEFMMKDTLGRTLIAAPNAWVAKVAPVEFGKEIGDREWLIEVDVLDVFVGGTDV